MPGPANDLNISQTGFQSFDGTSQFFGRTLTAGTGISITNGNGVSGNPVISSTGTGDLHVARYIVSAAGTSGTGANFSTISAALLAAQSDGVPATIFVMPGTYTENLQLVNGVSICSFQESVRGSVNVIGSVTTGSTIGCAISGIRFSITSGGALFSITDGSEIYFDECYFLIANSSTGFLDTTNSASAQTILNNCYGDISDASSLLFNKSGAGSFVVNFCNFTNGIFSGTNATAANTISDGKFFCYSSIMPFKLTTSSSASFFLYDTYFVFDISFSASNINLLTIGGSGPNIISGCYFDSGNQTAITVNAASTVINSDIKSSNAAVINGSSTLSYGQLTFSGTTSAITTTTQIPLAASNNAVEVKTPGSYPYTTVPQDYLILVDTSSARSIVPLANPTTGQVHIIKDDVGLAETNNITVTPSGKNIDGAASVIINTNYGSINIIYNGTQWNIV